MKQYNLIVVGGGIAGVAAAVAAARKDMRVLLIEQSGCLGGAMSNSLVYPFMTYAMRTGERRLLNDGIFTEMRQRKDAYNDTSWESYKFVFDDMVMEAGVEVLFHATAFRAQTEGRFLQYLEVVTKSGIMQFSADFFVDASGDGDLLYMVGCDYQLGRETDGFCQPMTTCFRVSNVDLLQFNRDKEMLQEKYKEMHKAGHISNPRENILVFQGLGDGILHFNTTRVIKHNPVDAFEISRAEIIARKQVCEMMSFLKAHSTAFENSSIISVAHHIGVRESRKLKGVHILTAEELKNCTAFEDTIALGNYEIDIHNPTGTGTELYYFKDDEYYRIPYRALLPKEYDNLLVAGRCLSATHEAHSAVRIMPICACTGEAAGVACAMAYKTQTTVQTVDVRLLQRELLQNGAAIY